MDISDKIYIPKVIKGNLYLPEAIEDAKIKWAVSDESVISLKNDGGIAPGAVKRGAKDVKVRLTAHIERGGDVTEMEYTSLVKSKARDKDEKDMRAYLFCHFMNTENESELAEQIYFGVSKDGRSWKTLGGGRPILKSVMGERGVRDSHIIRSPEGDRFYIVSTDLCINRRLGMPDLWKDCQTAGSKSIMVWESDDLVHWSKQRMAEVAPYNAGCAWAPESIWDEEKGAYMVFWASKTADDNFKYQRTYRCYTRDYRNFTEPELYIDLADETAIKAGKAVSNIDTDIFKSGEYYYRLNKNETHSTVVMERSKSLSGKFERINYILNGGPDKLKNQQGDRFRGYEGPASFKINGCDKWVILLDRFGVGDATGYHMYMTDELEKGIYNYVDDYKTPYHYRHGSVIPITEEEYDRLTKEFGI